MNKTLAQLALASKDFQPKNAVSAQFFTRSTVYTFSDQSNMTVYMNNTILPAYAH